MKWLDDNWEIAGGKPAEKYDDSADAGSNPPASASASGEKDAGDDLADFATKDDGKDKENVDLR